MALGVGLEKKLSKKFQPSSIINIKYRSMDLAVKTDAAGNAMQLFMGKANAEGNIIGDRFTRTIKYNSKGKLIKDHWERKGKAS